MALQFRQVIKGVAAAEFAGVDQAHENVTRVGSVLALEEEGVLAMQDGLLQGPLADVVVQRGTRFSEKQGALFPVPEHVRDGPNWMRSVVRPVVD